MVANVNTRTISTPLLTDNYFLPTFQMNIPPNLLHPIDLWTKNDVQKWFEYCIDEYSLGDINLNDFQMNGKALLLLNEDGFKQRSIRSGDILHKALQQHHSLIKSLTCQTFPYPLWNNFALPIRHFNIPFPPTYMHPPFDYKSKNVPDLHQSIRTRQMSNSSASSIMKSSEKHETDEQHEIIPISRNSNDNTRQIRYYHDRIDFRGEILMKPPGAKTCRILWEFLFILLEDSQYESIIHWENREKMIFRIIQADKLAALWGLQKNRLSMTYEKLSRGMRYYYSNNIISKEQSKRLLYRFMRSPEEIRKNTKRNNITPNLIYPTINKKTLSEQYLQLFSTYSSLDNHLLPPRTNSISKSDRSSSSSPQSEDSEKQYSSSTKRKQTLPISLTNCLSLDQPLNLAIHQEEKFFHSKKPKFLSHLEQ